MINLMAKNSSMSAGERSTMMMIRAKKVGKMIMAIKTRVSLDLKTPQELRQF